MLHEETLEAGTLALIKKLSADNRLNNFVLVGGTALSLQLGHRKSIDIDLFAAKPFDPKSIAGHIESVYNGKDIAVLGNAVFSYINGIKTDMLAHGYEWVGPLKEADGISMASLEDIGAMKLNAIVNSGQRLKDYVDIHYLLEQRNLKTLTDAYTAKYPDANPAIVKNALLYHTEINFKVDLGLLNREFKWQEVKARLKEAVAQPKKLFQAKQNPSIELPKHEDRHPSQHQGKGRRR
jgi:Nucleotidyl transferase AbiEii toxin, Type IV TA system